MLVEKCEDEYCIVCCKPKDHTHHLIYGRGIRELADQDELTIPLCNEHHSEIHANGMAGHLSKMLGQLEWEHKYSMDHPNCDPDGVRTMFMARYGRSWL